MPFRLTKCVIAAVDLTTYAIQQRDWLIFTSDPIKARLRVEVFALTWCTKKQNLKIKTREAPSSCSIVT